MRGEPQKVVVNISTRTIVNIVLIGLLIVAVFVLRDVVLVLLTSIVIASFVESGVKKLREYKFSRTLAVVVIYFIGILITTLVFYLITPVLIKETSGLVELASKYNSSGIIGEVSSDISGARSFVSSFPNGTESSLIENIQAFVSNFSEGVIGIFSVAFGGIINFLLIVVISFYLATQENGISNFLRIILPLKQEEYAIDLWQRTERKLGFWMQGQLLLSLIIGVITYIGLLILGVKYAFILALITAFFELIPFGLILAIVPAVVIAYVDGGITLGFITLALYLVVHQFEVYLIQPFVIKKVVGISPLMVIISIVIGSQLAGFWGIILAVPVAVCVLEFMDDVEKRKRVPIQPNE